MMASDSINFSIVLNGKPTAPKRVPADLRLIDFLNESEGLTGTKFCCGIGVCRACTVAVERVPGAQLEPLLSCSTAVAEVNGQGITTVEGLADEKGLSPLQTAFLEEFAFQCGYSTPGFLMAAHVLIDRLRRAPIRHEQVDETILEAVGQHVCRCTGYVRYYAAIRKVILATPGLVK